MCAKFKQTESWTIKKAECQRIDALELWCWRRLLGPLDSKEIQPVYPKGNQPWIFIGRTDAEAPVLWPLMRRVNSLEKTLMLGKIEGRRRRGDRGWNGWMASLTRCTWVWASSGSWWWKEALVCCSPWGRRVGHNWATQLNWIPDLHITI